MKVVNRAALVVRPKEPYIRWAASLDPEAPEGVRDLSTEVSVYLVPQDLSGEDETPPLELFLSSDLRAGAGGVVGGQG